MPRHSATLLSRTSLRRSARGLRTGGAARLIAAALACMVVSMLGASVASAQFQRLPPEKRPGSIAGTVQVAPGEPAVGVTVGVVGTVLQTLALPDGTFRISEVPPGVYSLHVTGRVYQSVLLEDVVVRPSQATTLTIYLRRYPVLSDVRVATPARHPQPIYESSASVTVVEPSEPPFVAGHSIERVLASTPGIQLDGALPTMRGADAGVMGVGARVGLFVDGIPMTSPDLGMPLHAAVPLAAVEQIEIVRGAATTLYGPGVISGAINVVTPRPAERHRALVTAYTGVYTDPGIPRPWGARPQRFSGADVMWTRRSEQVGALVAGTLFSDDGYREHEAPSRYDLFGRLNFFLSRGAELQFTGLIGRSEHGPQSTWRGSDSALFAGIDDSLAVPVVTTFQTLAGEYRGVDSKSLSFVVRGVLQGVSVDHDVYDSVSRRSSATRLLGEAHLTSFVNRRISISYGGAAQFDIGESPQYGDAITRIVGAYGRMEFANLLDIVAHVGTRVDIVHMPTSEQENVLEISPSAGVAYTPVPSTSFRASLARGYRPPSIAERRFVTDRFGGTFEPNRTLTPEQSWQGEVGAAHRIELGTTSIVGDIAFYLHEYFGMIAPVTRGHGRVITFVNLNRARILGVDVDLRATIGGGTLVAAVGVSAVSARDVRTDTELPGRAPLSATASLTWRPRPLEVIVTWRHVARIPVIDPVTRESVIDAEDRTTTNLIDLRAALDLERYIEIPLGVHVDARNLMQSRGFDGIGHPAPIRSIELGVGVRL